MHGCVTQPESIVLTRKHYLRYADRNQALSSIVEASLMQQHMLFVGFSLRDDNFYRYFSLFYYCLLSLCFCITLVVSLLLCLFLSIYLSMYLCVVCVRVLD